MRITEPDACASFFAQASARSRAFIATISLLRPKSFSLLAAGLCFYTFSFHIFFIESPALAAATIEAFFQLCLLFLFEKVTFESVDSTILQQLCHLGACCKIQFMHTVFSNFASRFVSYPSCDSVCCVSIAGCYFVSQLFLFKFPTRAPDKIGPAIFWRDKSHGNDFPRSSMV